MKVVLDVEGNGYNPTKVWLVVCLDVVTGHTHIFRNLSDDPAERDRFINWFDGVELCIGHNILGYDLPVLDRLLGVRFDVEKCLDTFIVSKLVDYPREGHSVESYGIEFGLPKGDHSDYTKWSQEMEDYCIRDCEITLRIYKKYLKYLSNSLHRPSIRLEHQFQCIVNNLEYKGFTLDIKLCTRLLDKVTQVLLTLDKDILEAFPKRLKLIREVTPKETKYGSISLSSIPRDMRIHTSELTVGAAFSYCTWVEFNPASHKQIIRVLNEAGWSPVVKTKAHIEAERELSQLKRSNRRTNGVAPELQAVYNTLTILKEYGWKVNEENLTTLPASAPAPARLLAKRILHEARRRTLTEWLNLVQSDGRVHGKFQGIGAWTHRMSHQKPNMANITNEFDLVGNVKLLGKELRQCWTVPEERLLVGVDAEGIQLRIFAHYIQDSEFTDALVRGRKDDKTDPHSLNQRILGSVCKSRAAAKRFIFALLLGAGVGKLAEILACDVKSAQQALERLLVRYTGFARLKQEVIPADAERGWFTGIDGRRVRILGETAGSRRHLAMSGYLQNGEAVIIKTAAVIAAPQIEEYDSFLLNIIHDEYQVETPNDLRIAVVVAEIIDEAIRESGRRLNLRCPLAGSYRNDHGKYTIGKNWYQTH